MLEAGQDILYICFSSGLSNTISSAQLAAETLRERYPQRSIQIVDSLAATYGEGLVVVYAGRNREAGMDWSKTPPGFGSILAVSPTGLP